jgi:hypothetical protein
MILDGLEGDPSAGWDAAGWFLFSGPWKIQLTQSQFQAIMSATKLTKDPNHCFPTTTMDLDTSNG